MLSFASSSRSGDRASRVARARGSATSGPHARRRGRGRRCDRRGRRQRVGPRGRPGRRRGGRRPLHGLRGEARIDSGTAVSSNGILHAELLARARRVGTVATCNREAFRWITATNGGAMATKTTQTFSTRIHPGRGARTARRAPERAARRQLRPLLAAQAGALERQGHRLHPAARALRRDRRGRARLRRRDRGACDRARRPGARDGTQAASATTLDEYPVDAVAGEKTIEVVADRLASYGASVRSAIDEATAAPSDLDTADLSPRCHGRSTSTSGSWRRTSRPRGRLTDERARFASMPSSSCSERVRELLDAFALERVDDVA